MKKINYGIDAPQVIRNLLIIGFIALVFSFFPPDLSPPVSAFIRYTFLMPGLSLIAAGGLMYGYARWGKSKHRDRLLNLYAWKGNEKVLDVGTGLGLLMIGVAKRLTTGTCYGIDIFNAYDLSDNAIEQTKINAELENVLQKVHILNENILKTSFEDNSFDVVVSNLCLHNIYDSTGRAQACREIVRILKMNGTVILSDFKNMDEYQTTFEQLGMNVRKAGTYFLTTFPPLTVIIATKQ
ncbi:MAG: class I SAM-dependent methyltransferase [Bacteroidetes bacterium]|nr:class I SAM-dependent methyltransferase [Bacteroidota bacterium]